MPPRTARIVAPADALREQSSVAIWFCWSYFVLAFGGVRSYCAAARRDLSLRSGTDCRSLEATRRGLHSDHPLESRSRLRARRNLDGHDLVVARRTYSPRSTRHAGRPHIPVGSKNRQLDGRRQRRDIRHALHTQSPALRPSWLAKETLDPRATGKIIVSGGACVVLPY